MCETLHVLTHCTHRAPQIATKEKNAAEERMAIVQAKLDEMQAQFDAAMAQKQLLEDDAAPCQKKMNRAAALLHALAGVLQQPAQPPSFGACICWPLVADSLLW